MTLGSISDFVVDNVPSRCALKSAVIEYAGLERGLDVERIDDNRLLIRTAAGVLPFVGINGPNSTVIGRWICDHKEAQRALAANAGLRVTEFAAFPLDARSRGLEYARKLGWPVAVKPNNLSRSRGVTAAVGHPSEFHTAWQRARQAISESNRRAKARIIVERHVDGEDFRFFVVAGRVISVTHKARANVTGDGVMNVADLITAKNEKRATNPYLREFPIPHVPELLDALAAAGRTLNDVPHAGERLTLRTRSTLNAGGESVDVTDEADPFFKELAVAAVKAVPGLVYAGVDIMARDITARPATETEYVLGEVEYSPAPLAHFPAIGSARDMAGAILTHYLDETRYARASP